MIHKLLLLIAGTVAGGYVMAQPTLTSTTNNPLPTERFYGHRVDPTGLTPGASGGPVTWNFASLTQTDMDTVTYLSCASTPFCDSFPGTNLVSYDNTDYMYGIANASKVTFTGIHTSGFNIHLTGGTNDVIFYPLTLGSSHKDSFTADVNFMGFHVYRHEVDSFICDAWGTITLPSGTYSNALRVHQFAVSTDSSTFDPLTTGMVESYTWYVADFHQPLFTISIDTSGGDFAEYYTQNRTLGIAGSESLTGNFRVYPNPASEEINLNFDLTDVFGATITVSDVTGRTVATVGNSEIHTGTNNIRIPVSHLPGGIYLVTLLSVEGNSVRKVTVTK